MTINEIIIKIKDICLAHEDVNSFNVGNTWDMSTGKGDVYPNVWLELPVLISYSTQNKPIKSFTFSFDVLMVPENDNVLDEFDKISQCEVIADQILTSIKTLKGFSITNSPSGLSVKNINGDMACGVRIDLVLTTNRECL